MNTSLNDYPSLDDYPVAPKDTRTLWQRLSKGFKIFLFILLSMMGLAVFSMFALVHHSKNHYTYKIERVGTNQIYYTHHYWYEGGRRGSTIMFIPLNEKNKVGFSGEWAITEVTNKRN